MIDMKWLLAAARDENNRSAETFFKRGFRTRVIDIDERYDRRETVVVARYTTPRGKDDVWCHCINDEVIRDVRRDELYYLVNAYHILERAGIFDVRVDQFIPPGTLLTPELVAKFYDEAIFSDLAYGSKNYVKPPDQPPPTIMPNRWSKRLTEKFYDTSFIGRVNADYGDYVDLPDQPDPPKPEPKRSRAELLADAVMQEVVQPKPTEPGFPELDL